MPTYYKVLNEQNNSAHNGRPLDWKLPRKRKDGTIRPGAWMPAVTGDLILCSNGYHVCEGKDLIRWLHANIYTAEIRGGQIDGDEKTVTRQIRLLTPTGWNEMRARLFAADCAEYVLHLYEQKYPNDDRPRKAIEAARLYAQGLIDDDARSAAESAAWRAAWSAAESAARRAAWSAAESAARRAAWSAARSAAESAAESAARRAAWSAARSAAESAVQEWTTARLALYLLPELPNPMPPIIGYGLVTQEGSK